jgi:hypothetical protein
MTLLADAPADPDRVPDGLSRPAPGRGGVPAAVWWITALQLTTLLLYSVLLPTYRAPDEPHHNDLAHQFSETFHYPAWNKAETSRGIVNSQRLTPMRGENHLTADEAAQRRTRPSLDALDRLDGPRGINHLAQHPPLYYAVAGTLERGAQIVTGIDHPAYDLEAWFYRFVSILLVTPLPLLIWVTGRRLGLPRAVAITATLVPLAIPQFLHIGAAANNDSLMWLLFWLLTPLVLRLADGDLRPRTAALAGLVTGLALYTKGFAVVLPVWVLFAFGLAWRRLGKEATARLTVDGLIYSGVAFATGGWWWLVNILRYGEPLPSRYGDFVKPVAATGRDYDNFVRSWATLTTRRFWGDFGFFDVHLPTTVVTVATIVLLTGIVACLVRRDQMAGSPIGNRLLLAAPLLLLVAMQFGGTLRAYAHLGRYPGLQGRYWFGALAALAVAAALGWANLIRRWVRWLPLAVLAAVGLMNLCALATILPFYWGSPTDGPVDRLRALIAWSPFSGRVLVAGAVVGSVAAVGTAVQLLMVGDWGDRGGPATPPAVPGPENPTAVRASAVP